MRATVIALLLAVAAVAAVVVPNLHTAAERGRQRRSMSDLRTIGSAVEQYSVEHGFRPTAANLDELAALLEPRYVKQLPRRDGWGTPFRYHSYSLQDGHVVDGPATSYAIRCAGSDRAWQHEDITDYTVYGATTSFASDILFGSFVQTR